MRHLLLVSASSSSFFKIPFRSSGSSSGSCFYTPLAFFIEFSIFSFLISLVSYFTCALATPQRYFTRSAFVSSSSSSSPVGLILFLDDRVWLFQHRVRQESGPCFLGCLGFFSAGLFFFFLFLRFFG